MTYAIHYADGTPGYQRDLVDWMDATTLVLEKITNGTITDSHRADQKGNIAGLAAEVTRLVQDVDNIREWAQRMGVQSSSKLADVYLGAAKNLHNIVGADFMDGVGLYQERQEGLRAFKESLRGAGCSAEHTEAFISAQAPIMNYWGRVVQTVHSDRTASTTTVADPASASTANAARREKATPAKR